MDLGVFKLLVFRILDFFAWLKALKDAGGSPTTTAATRRQPQAIQPSATFCRVQTFTRNFSFKGWVRWIRWIRWKIGQKLAEKNSDFRYTLTCELANWGFLRAVSSFRSDFSRLDFIWRFEKCKCAKCVENTKPKVEKPKESLSQWKTTKRKGKEGKEGKEGKDKRHPISKFRVVAAIAWLQVGT